MDARGLLICTPRDVSSLCDIRALCVRSILDALESILLLSRIDRLINFCMSEKDVDKYFSLIAANGYCTRADLPVAHTKPAIL